MSKQHQGLLGMVSSQLHWHVEEAAGHTSGGGGSFLDLRGSSTVLAELPESDSVSENFRF